MKRTGYAILGRVRVLLRAWPRLPVLSQALRSLAVWIALTSAACRSSASSDRVAVSFDPETDLLSLHYDHAPDKDDGQSAAADRTVLVTLFGRDWFAQHVVGVSGAYGINAAEFNDSSDAVMEAAFGDVGGWLDAHEDRGGATEALTRRWRAALAAGGDVWVKEGGQSDLTASVVRRLLDDDPALPTAERIHVVQHSDWNETQTSPNALRFVREMTHYVRIPDANAYLNVPGGDEAFRTAATSDSAFGAVWRVAFAYYDPHERLDFSDTGELLHILDLGEMSLDAFRRRFLSIPRAP